MEVVLGGRSLYDLEAKQDTAVYAAETQTTVDLEHH